MRQKTGSREGRRFSDMGPCHFISQSMGLKHQKPELHSYDLIFLSHKITKSPLSEAKDVYVYE